MCVVRALSAATQEITRKAPNRHPAPPRAVTGRPKSGCTIGDHGTDTTILAPQATAPVWPQPTLIAQPAGAVATAQAAHPPAAAAVLPEPAEPPDLDCLGDRIAELASRIDAATYELLCYLHQFNQQYGWEGFRSCAHWLNWRTGLDLGAAREKLRVAAALADLNHLSRRHGLWAALVLHRARAVRAWLHTCDRSASGRRFLRRHRRAGGAAGAWPGAQADRAAQPDARAGTPGVPRAEHPGGRGRHASCCVRG